MIVICCMCNADVESKRASGLTAIWLARNRFAVLHKTSQVTDGHVSLYCIVVGGGDFNLRMFKKRAKM